MEKMEKNFCLDRFLCSHLEDELQDSKDYLKFAKIAREIDEPVISSMLLLHARQELNHYCDLREALEKSVKDIKDNLFYPLLENFESWAENLSEELENF